MFRATFSRNSGVPVLVSAGLLRSADAWAAVYGHLARNFWDGVVRVPGQSGLEIIADVANRTDVGGSGSLTFTIANDNGGIDTITYAMSRVS